MVTDSSLSPIFLVWWVTTGGILNNSFYLLGVEGAVLVITPRLSDSYCTYAYACDVETSGNVQEHPKKGKGGFFEQMDWMPTQSILVYDRMVPPFLPGFC